MTASFSFVNGDRVALAQLFPDRYIANESCIFVFQDNLFVWDDGIGRSREQIEKNIATWRGRQFQCVTWKSPERRHKMLDIVELIIVAVVSVVLLHLETDGTEFHYLVDVAIGLLVGSLLVLCALAVGTQLHIHFCAPPQEEPEWFDSAAVLFWGMFASRTILEYYDGYWWAMYFGFLLSMIVCSIGAVIGGSVPLGIGLFAEAWGIFVLRILRDWMRKPPRWQKIAWHRVLPVVSVGFFYFFGWWLIPIRQMYDPTFNTTTSSSTAMPQFPFSNSSTNMLTIP
jgi:uncharacterized membrane protein YczE